MQAKEETERWLTELLPGDSKKAKPKKEARHGSRATRAADDVHGIDDADGDSDDMADYELVASDDDEETVALGRGVKHHESEDEDDEEDIFSETGKVSGEGLLFVCAVVAGAGGCFGGELCQESCTAVLMHTHFAGAADDQADARRRRVQDQ